MAVMERVKNVRIVLKEEYIVHSVLVLEGLSHPVNIGLQFLYQHYATIFSPRRRKYVERASLKVCNHHGELVE